VGKNYSISRKKSQMHIQSSPDKTQSGNLISNLGLEQKKDEEYRRKVQLAV
jgi:hypothetical protein